MRRKRMKLALVGIGVAGLLLGACGDDDDQSLEEADAIDSTTSTSATPTTRVADEDADVSTTTQPTEMATVEVAGMIYEFTVAETCELGAPGSVPESGTNPAGGTADVSFVDAGGEVGIWADAASTGAFFTVDGTTWEGYGAAPLLVITDNTAVWTAQMSADQGTTLEDATITVTC